MRSAIIIRWMLLLVSAADSLKLQADWNPTNQTSENIPVYRYDVKSVWKKNELFKTLTNATFNDNQPRLQSLVSGQAAFNVTFDCYASSAVCAKAMNSFQIALQYITQGIQIKTQIKVHAIMYSFCNGKTSGCDLANTLGQATSSSYFMARADSSKQYAYYPQALIKQFNTDYNLQYSEFDIHAEFNTDFSFWYESDGIPATSTSIPLSFVVAHEVTHGLGFDSFMYPYSAVYGSALSINGTDPVGPTVVYALHSPNNYLIEISNTWDGVHIFDMFLYDTVSTSTFRQLMNRIFAYRTIDGTQVQSFYNAFKASGDPWNALMTMTSAMTSGSRRVKFLTGSGDCANPYISTFTGFNLGSTGPHLDYSTYYGTSDFLMVHAMANNMGRSLADTIALYNQTERVFGVYGARELQILGAMGWSTAIYTNPSTSLRIQSSYGIDVNAINTDTFPAPASVASGTCTKTSYSPVTEFAPAKVPAIFSVNGTVYTASPLTSSAHSLTFSLPLVLIAPLLSLFINK